MTKNIGAVIIARNEEKNLPDCLKSIRWVKEIIVIDNDSTDRTPKIARKYGAKVYKFPKGDFASRKNFAYEKVTKKWFLSIDADERVTPLLKKEILDSIESMDDRVGAFAIPRRNFVLGKELKHGWWPDYVIRLFKKENFESVQNILHEQPKFKGELKYLKHALIHQKHNNIEEMVAKTNEWSNVEAWLMYNAHHPPMNFVRFTTATLRELTQRFLKDKAFLDGKVGIIYGLYQVYSRLTSYMKLWEMQINKITKLPKN